MAGTARDRYWNPSTFGVAERVKRLAKELGNSPAQVATAWALAKPGITSVIVGSSRPEQTIEFDAKQIKRLRSLGYID